MRFLDVLSPVQEQPAMGMRPNTTPLSEIYSHLWREVFFCSARLSQLGYWYHTYVAYSMSTWVCTTHFYLSLFRWIFIKINTSSFSHKMAVCMGRTLFLSMASIALPWTNIIENLSKQLHFYFVSKQRGGEKWHEVKNSKNLGYNPSLWLVFTGVSGRFLTLQQISAYVKTCGWRLTSYCNTVTIVISPEQ